MSAFGGYAAKNGALSAPVNRVSATGVNLGVRDDYLLLLRPFYISATIQTNTYFFIDIMYSRMIYQ